MNSEIKRKTADLLSVCFKAGKAVKGFDSVKDSVISGKAFAVITAADASAKTIKEVRFICDKYGIKVLPSELEKNDISRLCGKETAVIAVCDKGFAGGFLKIIG